MPLHRVGLALRANLAAFIRGLGPRVGARLRLDLLHKGDAAKPRPYHPSVLRNPSSVLCTPILIHLSTFTQELCSILHLCTGSARTPSSVLWSHLSTFAPAVGRFAPLHVTLHRPLELRRAPTSSSRCCRCDVRSYRYRKGTFSLAGLSGRGCSNSSRPGSRGPQPRPLGAPP